MCNPDRVRNLYVDCRYNLEIKPDDFIVTIGKTKSNSVYHVLESKVKERSNGVRFYLKVLKSDLLTCIKRDNSQAVIPMKWYNRN